MKKSVFVLALISFLFFSSVSFAQTVGWIGTDWIESGSVIESAPLASNLDWLFENKVHKPFNCNEDNNRLSFLGGEWGCQTVTVADTPDNCTFNGATVLHGGTVPAYETSAVAYGETCNQEIRTCNDGTLSGSFTNSSCSVGDPTTCVFNGVAVGHGASVTAYESETVAAGGTCESETRTCTNGTLSGSYGFDSCAVEDPIPEEEPLPPIGVTTAWRPFANDSSSVVFNGVDGRLIDNCLAGETQTELMDGIRGTRTIEDDKSRGERVQLCLGLQDPEMSFTSEWRTGGCSAGMVHTGVYDDNHTHESGYNRKSSRHYKHNHHMSEEEETRNEQYWCLGLEDPSNQYEIQFDKPYSLSCGSGWTRLVITNNNKWNMNNEDGGANRSLCMRVVEKGYTGDSDAGSGSGGSGGGSGGSGGGIFDNINVNLF